MLSPNTEKVSPRDSVAPGGKYYNMSSIMAPSLNNTSIDGPMAITHSESGIEDPTIKMDSIYGSKTQLGNLHSIDEDRSSGLKSPVQGFESYDSRNERHDKPRVAVDKRKPPAGGDGGSYGHSSGAQLSARGDKPPKYKNKEVKGKPSIKNLIKLSALRD